MGQGEPGGSAGRSQSKGGDKRGWTEYCATNDDYEDSGSLKAETIGDGWIVDGSAYRTWANRASEMANDRICGVCKEETTEWTCQCGDPDEDIVLRGARNKIREGVARFNMQETNLVMEL